MTPGRLRFLVLSGPIGMATPPVAGLATDTACGAHVRAMNSPVSGLSAGGDARFTVVGDQLTIGIDRKGVSPASTLPDSAASLGPIPAQVTRSTACPGCARRAVARPHRRASWRHGSIPFSSI